MIDVVPYQPEYLRKLRLQPAQLHCAAALTDELLEATTELDAYAILVAGEPIAVAGLFELWSGRAMAWSYLAEAAGPHMTAITRTVRNYLDGSEYRRIEAYVDVGFEAGARWVEMLGLTKEGLLRAFTPDGRDQVLYARIRNDG